ADDPDALVEDQLDHARVVLHPLGVVKGAPRGPHRAEIPQPALRLGDHLLGNDEHVTVCEAGSVDDHRRQVVAGPDLRQPDHAPGFEPHDRPASMARSDGSSRSRASSGASNSSNRTPRSAASRANLLSESSPKCIPTASGGLTYRALVPPRPVAGAARTAGLPSLRAASSISRITRWPTRGRSLEISRTAPAPRET